MSLQLIVAKNDPLAYSVAAHNGWLPRLVEELNFDYTQRMPVGSWTLDLCLIQAREFNTIKDWRNGHSSSFNAAKKRPDWYEKCIAHMNNRMQAGHWSDENCLNAALNFNDVRTWSIESPGSYRAAVKKCILDKCTAHMDKRRLSWTPENCKLKANEYPTKAAWKRGSCSSYNKTRTEDNKGTIGWIGLFKECCAHMQ